MNSFAKTFFGADPQQILAGSLQLDIPFGWFALILVLLALSVVFGFGYTKLSNSAPSAIVRIALVSVIAFALFRPALTIQSEQTIDGETVVMIDNSISMKIDDGSVSRASVVNELFASGDILESQRVRLVAVGETTSEIETVEELEFDSPRSNLTDALHDVVAGKLGSDTASVVLISDGGNSSDRDTSSVLRQLTASGIAVNVIGVGSEEFANDIEIADVRLTPRVIAGDTVEARIVIKQSGYSGQNVTLNVEQDDRLISNTPISFTDDSSYVVTVPVKLDEPGQHRVSFTVDPLSNELLAENNSVTTTILADDQPVDVLHFEGEPRFEVKFLRRALLDESFIRLRSLVRTAENKYYRIGVVDADELKDGFPESEEELFRYDILVIGSASSELLGEREQTLIRDFVARRGGGLLLLGSANSFAEGGFRNSILADTMPVVLTDKARTYRNLAKVKPAPDQPRTLIRLSDETWERLPELTVVNPLRTAKPGASVVLEGHVDNEEPLIVLATHRYGRGKVATLAVRNSWRWQMHADIGPDDLSHETLMRQITRWLGRDIPGQTELTVKDSRVALGQSVEIALRSVSKTFESLQGNEAYDGKRLEVTTPSGQIILPEFISSSTASDLGETSFIANETGRYDLRVVDDQDVTLASDQVEVFAAGDEFFSAQRDSEFLGAIARQTGGHYLSTADTDRLPEIIESTKRTEIRQQRIEIWKTPFMLCLVLGLAVIGWLLRKRGAMA